MYGVVCYRSCANKMKTLFDNLRKLLEFAMVVFMYCRSCVFIWTPDVAFSELIESDIEASAEGPCYAQLIGLSAGGDKWEGLDLP